MRNLKTRQELIKEYLKFFKSKNHKIIPNSSLIPSNDPTVLFTTAGMHPLVPYILGQKHPLGKNLVNVQKCIRTVDINEVGDKTHTTFFEMLGNWSLGDYWKKESIEYYFEFLTKKLEIPIKKLSVSCFKGDKDAPKDTESAKVWLSLGIPKDRLVFLPKSENWWGPAGEIGPCGPDIEIFYWTSSKNSPKKYDLKDRNWIEIGTDVLIAYNKTKDAKFMPLKQKTIDFGGGVERTLAALNQLDDIYETTIFQPIIKEIESISKKKYKGNEKSMRIISDHIKAAVFIISDGVLPSNTEQGYVLRRLIRRAIRHGKKLEINKEFIHKLVPSILEIYPDYSELKKNKNLIIGELKKEELRFTKTLEQGMRKFNSMSKDKKISGKEAFLLFQSYGFPIEITQELAKEKKIKIDIKAYENETKKHQILSRTSTKGKFSSGLADSSEKTTKLHTATHLLNQALRTVLGKEVRQKGSNITSERLRFDFNFPRKLTDKEIKKVEDLVNKKIKEGLKVTKEEMPLKKALASGAQSEFGAKYPNIVSVYTIGNFSKEICTGPHVINTKKIGKFKIIKEESSSAGIRRIKAVVE